MVATPFTPISAFLEEISKTQWMQIVRMYRYERLSSLLSIEEQVPKLDVAGSIPVSRSIFSIIYGYSERRQETLNAVIHAGIRRK